uniref:Uncharacterized protein n=1 Tax=Eutreptiella gymnastica TaxID=73025 RepID=A0A7S4GA79_9EUGL
MLQCVAFAVRMSMHSKLLQPGSGVFSRRHHEGACPDDVPPLRAHHHPQIQYVMSCLAIPSSIKIAQLTILRCTCCYGSSLFPISSNHTFWLVTLPSGICQLMLVTIQLLIASMPTAASRSLLTNSKPSLLHY